MKGRKHLEVFERIIELVRGIIDRNLDPFEVDVVELFDKLKPYVSKLERNEEFLLDVQAVYELSRLVWRQEDWLKLRASLLYIDPLLALLRIDSMNVKELAEVLLLSWHPIVEREQLTYDNLRVALEYWRSLLPLEERRLELIGAGEEGGEITEDDLLKMGFMSREEFNRVLMETWRDLRGRGERLDYWKYICSETYDETVRRAYILSFLASYGYVTMEVDPIKDRIFIIPFDRQVRMGGSKSIAIPITREKWLEVRGRVGGGGSTQGED